MEYEKHIKRLVLGYLRNECKTAYKAFLKYNFQNHNKHIATRVAGQTLEDILHIYSRIQEVVQGRLEETDYYKERSAEFSSPSYLVDQLVYLLERGVCLTPASTPCPRSPGESSVAEAHNEVEVVTTHTSDVETTPEHTLPGNIPSNCELYQSETPLRRSISPNAKTSHIGKICATDGIIPEAMVQKFLKKPDFSEKLASNINTVLNTPEVTNVSEKGENDKAKEGMGRELDDTIKNIMKMTEDDPMFEDIIQEFLGTSTSTPKNKIKSSSTCCSTNTCDSAIKNNYTEKHQRITEEPAISDNVAYNNLCITPKVSSDINHINASVIQNPYVVNNNPGLYVIPQQTTTTLQSTTQQQQFYIVNQPVVIPQPSQVMQVIQAAPKQVAIQTNLNNIAPRTTTSVSEQDIMSMPTIILNEHNEITYADPSTLTSTTPRRLNEARNIKEYLALYGTNDQSPTVKPYNKKNSKVSLKPTPTIKVEIFQRDIPLENKNESTVTNKKPLELPNLNATMDKEKVHGSVEVAPVESKTDSQDKIKFKSLSSVCTPSPHITNLRKPTPKSGSHVRNLTFPSPLKRTPSEDAKTVESNSPSAINRKQATKDLFNNETEKINNKSKNSKTSPKERRGARKASSKKGIKKSVAKKKGKVERGSNVDKTSNSWDTNLRKMVAPIIQANNTTPVTRKSIRKQTKKSGECISDSDGKKLEEAIKSHEIKKKSKRKTPTKNKPDDTNLHNPDTDFKTKDIDAKSATKILSPSKLNANKRNILSNELDDLTPDMPKDSVQYPLSSKTRRNINSLLETPLKDSLDSSTPGDISHVAETPFTPMLKANLKDFTIGDNIFSIDTPNFPVTPGFSIVSSTIPSYYIPKESENNKATEAIVTLEEKKSSVRSTDDEDGKVYGCKDVLDSFNKSRVGKKNLELLERQDVSWDVNSDKEDKSDENSEDETNNTVIQHKNMVKTILPKKRRVSGKLLNVLAAEMFQDDTNLIESEISTKEASENSMEKENPIAEECQKSNSDLPKTANSNDTEILIQKNFHDKIYRRESLDTEIQVILEKCDDDALELKTDNSANSSKNVESYSPRTEEIRKAINSISVGATPTIGVCGFSLKQQLEEKKERFIKEEKRVLRKSPRRAIVKPQPNNGSPRKKRKSSSPRKLAKPKDSKKLHGKDNTKEVILKQESKNTDTLEKDQDSQDEFFKKSGTNLHRKSKNVEKKDSDLSRDSVDNVREEESAQKELFKNKVDKSLEPDESPDPEDCKNEEMTNEKSLDVQSISYNNEDKLEHLTTDNELDDSFDTCFYLDEHFTFTYDESKPSQKKFEEYNLKNLEKKMRCEVPCTNGKDECVVISVSPNEILLDIKPSNEHETTDSGKDEGDENDQDNKRSGRKRKRRSDSSSLSTAGKKQKAYPLLNENNIEKLLTKLHGPN